ncbi:DBH-like monooxygenase protein 1 homolog [Antedon mediterranea]|uniref:DBH-like monooxygenase protein 1 homolog n=1 Tax=Antedon mediterranea TaxID=105859 RepID=UPI003AF89029
MTLMSNTLVFLLCTLVVFGEMKFNHNVFLDSEENVQLFWKVEDDNIIFEVRANTTGYFGIGLNSNGGMKGADIMMAWVVDGTPFISSDTVRVIWSYHPDDPDSRQTAVYHGPQRRGVKSVVFIDVGSSKVSELPEGTTSFDILMDNVLVPEDTVTTYWANHREIPELATPHHVIRIEPIVQPGNEGIVHHLVLKECYGLTNITGNRSLHYVDAMYQYNACSKMIYAWAVGGGPLEFPENVGYKIAGEDPVKFLQLTIHYDNAQLLKGVYDNSGVRIYYTSNIQQYDSSMLMLLTEGDMKIFAVFLHAHLAGVGIRATHYRNGKYLGEISKDSAYDFDLQEVRYLKEPWIVKPEDDLLVECTYNTMDRTNVTYGGLATTEEMCLAFLFYYPKSNAGKCYSSPQPSTLEENLNLGVTKNKSFREALQQLDWTKERVDVLKKWWKEAPRMSYCSNHSGHNAFHEDELVEEVRLYGYVETKSLDNLIDIQNGIVEENQCSRSTSSKGSLFTVFILAILPFI